MIQSRNFSRLVGFYDFPIDSHGRSSGLAFLRFEGRNIVRAWTERSLSKIAHSSRLHSSTRSPTLTIRGWQRDLSASYEKIGDVLVAAGKRENGRDRNNVRLTRMTSLRCAPTK
jgi:hypothetical protein